MNMEEVLRTAINHIRTGSLDNEAQVKQAVILPILRALDWDDSDPAELRPEYSVDNGRVDYALLGKRGAPLVFIEAKGIGRMDLAGEEQLFGYATNKGIPFLVLTDGDYWDFYLSMAAGIPAERRFYRVKLTREERIPEYALFLVKHLQKRFVVSGEAKRAAEQLHESNQERDKARKEIPRVWRSLLEAPDEMLRDLLMEQVASACGTMPDLEDVESFLREQLSDSKTMQPGGSSTSPRTEVRKSPPESPKPPRKRNSKPIAFELENRRVETGAAYLTLAEVLKEFHRRDPQFMERFAAKTSTRKRRLVARNRQDLYPGRPDFAEKSSLDLKNGWWLGHNLNADTIRSRIKTACEIAGVKFGSALKLIES